MTKPSNIHPQINRINQSLEPILKDLHQHPVYTKIKDVEDLQIFLEHHVFAVWDFMSLLKFLQAELTCVKVPWTPTDSPVARRLINEIVMGEESDVDFAGQPASHFEQYIDGMMGCNADTSEVYQLVDAIEEGVDVFDAIDELMTPEAVKNFLRFTFETIQTGETHKVAAAFAFGREDVIPDMFDALVKDLNEHFPGALVKFIYYLERHIELDSDTHGPLAMQMITELCGEDQQKWNDCLEVAEQSLQQRIALWDSIAECIDRKYAFLAE